MNCSIPVSNTQICVFISDRTVRNIVLRPRHSVEQTAGYRHDVFKKKLAGSRKYEDYLLRVLDTLPERKDNSRQVSTVNDAK